jgi:hypothetical protein
MEAAYCPLVQYWRERGLAAGDDQSSIISDQLPRGTKYRDCRVDGVKRPERPAELAVNPLEPDALFRWGARVREELPILAARPGDGQLLAGQADLAPVPLPTPLPVVQDSQFFRGSLVSLE